MVRVSPLCVVQFAAVAAAAYILLNTSFLDNILNVRAKPQDHLVVVIFKFKVVTWIGRYVLCVCE